jgi:hypothetical protein
MVITSGLLELYRCIVENVEYLNYLGSIITNDARSTREIKCWISMAEAEFNKKRSLVPKFKEETSKMLRFELSFLWC